MTSRHPLMSLFNFTWSFFKRGCRSKKFQGMPIRFVFGGRCLGPKALSGAERSGDSEHAVQCCGGASEEVTQVAQRLRRLEGRPEFLRVKGSVN